MAYDIRMVKLVNNEIVLGKYDAEKEALTDVAVVQTVPTQQGVQMLLMPFGYPFETELKGEVDLKHSIYEYANFPEDIKTKYLEASSNLTLSAPGGMGGMGLGGKAGGAAAAPGPDLSGLFKK